MQSANATRGGDASIAYDRKARRLNIAHQWLTHPGLRRLYDEARANRSTGRTPSARPSSPATASPIGRTRAPDLEVRGWHGDIRVDAEGVLLADGTRASWRHIAATSIHRHSLNLFNRWYTDVSLDAGDEVWWLEMRSKADAKALADAIEAGLAHWHANGTSFAPGRDG